MLTGHRFVAGACALLLAQAFAVPSAEAQTQTAPPVPAKPAPVNPGVSTPDTQVITIFGRPPSRRPGNRLTPIDLGSSASGCNFMGRTGGQVMIDAYFDDIYGTSIPADEVDGSGRRSMNTRSPYGDASTPTYTGPGSEDYASRRAMDPLGTTTTGPGGCTQAEVNFALGRAEMAAHDHSLKNAWEAYNAGDYPKALELFKYAYDKLRGNEEGGLMVGKMYLLGIGVPRDTQQAIVWLKKTADTPWSPPPFLRPPVNYYAMTPLVDASMTLAKIYAVGWDVPVDRDQARHWYSRADDMEFYPATHIMGRIYQSGYGVPRDVKKAISYFKTAGQMGFAPSQYALGQIYYNGDDGVPENKTLAGAWLLLAAKHNHPDALYAVGRMYELGEGGAKVDPQKALIYYKEAAVRGQTDAQNTIGVDFYTGSGLPKDLTGARRWFLAASERGNPDAMFNLAVMMVNGEGGPKDLVHAYCWFSLADKGGNDKAGAALAELAPKMTADERAQADALLNPPPAK